ncbi:hypothetical protein HOP50_03g26370 [Chloropicon primus]|uniref:Uncharacterized protein n=1 Tax=Chloropicon primus TaxID=1764295 RepID=A0A5B8MHK7_9CHLO|nr:hypothetical protein A3770_03p26360 [Chloropicon primus]UPQ99330.1 hypothetical protein HOP50_03g26370 [Chloropicon primus]|eukprot:QDZ20118.1 hypothetical protein A3770_03p26360 [Chloropicon primus]
MPLLDNRKSPKGRTRGKSKPASGRSEEMNWDMNKRCTLGDLCAQDKKKVSNLISKVVQLNHNNERMDKELETFRSESERLRQENMELHKLSSSLQTRLMQALMLAKTYQDQIKLKRRVFTVETQTTGTFRPRSPERWSGVNTTIPVHDFSNRGETAKGPEATGGGSIYGGGDEGKVAEDPPPAKAENLAKRVYEDRTLYYEAESGSDRVHRFQKPGEVEANDLAGAQSWDAPRAEDGSKVEEGLDFLSAEEGIVSEELEDIIGIINAKCVSSR